MDTVTELSYCLKGIEHLNCWINQLFHEFNIKLPISKEKLIKLTKIRDKKVIKARILVNQFNEDINKRSFTNRDCNIQSNIILKANELLYD